MTSRLIKTTLFIFLLFFSQNGFSQSKESKRVIKNIIKLSTETEFSQIAKMFDTTDGKKPVNPFILDYLWRDFEEKYGKFISSRTKKEYKKKETEYFIEELQFDSAFVELKIGINPKNKMVAAYLLHKQITKKQLALEKEYTLPSYTKKRNVAVKKLKFGNEPFIISGELTLPIGLKKTDKIPVVIIGHGSGPGDMNGKAGPLQPYKDIAYGLSTKGIAVLRFDKRTLTYGEEVSSDKKFDVNKETVDDIILAAAFLRNQKNINPEKVYVLGHSLAGMMLPRIGLRDPKLAGLIFMGAPAESLPDKIIEQMEYLTSLYPEKEKEYTRMKEEFVRLKTRWYDSTTSPRYLPFKSPPSYWDDLKAYKQTEVVKNVQQPMLVLQGEADYQVTMEDFELWKSALKQNKKAVFKSFPKLHHQMGAVNHDGLSVPDDYEIPVNVSEDVINTIYNWIMK